MIGLIIFIEMTGSFQNDNYEYFQKPKTVFRKNVKAVFTWNM